MCFLLTYIMSEFHLSQHFTNWNVSFWVLLFLSTMIFKTNTQIRKCVFHLSPHVRSLRQFRKTICLDYPGFWSVIELRLFAAAADSSPGGWIQVATVSSSGNWMQVTVDSILWLTRVPEVGYELRLILSCGWLEFRVLDTSYSWLHPTADSSFGGWIQLKFNSILWLTTMGGWFYLAAG